MKRISRTIIFILPLSLLLVACATAPEQEAVLQEANERYAELSSNEQIQSTAPGPLFDAQRALERAAETDEDAFRDHQLYLARQHMNIAQAIAERRQLESNRQALSEQADQLRLRAREQELETVKAELSALETEQTARGLLVTLGDVFFDVAETDLNPGAAPKLDQLAEFMRRHPDQRVVVEGHTDSTGPEDFNRTLSERRAEAVQEALEARGVEQDRIVTRGLGESRPVASNQTSGGRQLNRRVEIVFPEYGTS